MKGLPQLQTMKNIHEKYKKHFITRNIS